MRSVGAWSGRTPHEYRADSYKNNDRFHANLAQRSAESALIQTSADSQTKDREIRRRGDRRSAHRRALRTLNQYETPMANAETANNGTAYGRTPSSATAPPAPSVATMSGPRAGPLQHAATASAIAALPIAKAAPAADASSLPGFRVSSTT